MVYKPSVFIIVSGVATTLLGTLILWHFTKRRKRYARVGRVKKLIFYPVKSLKGIEVPELECKGLGVEVDGILDRVFMLISGENNKLITQREEPSLALLTVSVCNNELTISRDKGEPLKITIKQEISVGDKIKLCRVHLDEVEAVDYGDHAAEWFQMYLNRSDIRLVQFLSGLKERNYVGEDLEKIEAKRDYPIRFQDLAAIHLVSQSSLEELNKKLGKPSSEKNFRPNILIEGSPPFAEDEWYSLKFPDSGVELSTFSPCARCVMTTVDPTTGIKTNKEPLSVLRKFRMPKDPKLSKELNHAPCFGQHYCIDKPGKIKVGDDIWAAVKKNLYQYVEKS